MGPGVWCRAWGACAARTAAAHGCGGVGVLAYGQGDRHPATTGHAPRAGTSDRASGDTKAWQPFDLSTLAAGGCAGGGAIWHVTAERRSLCPGLPFGAAAGVRSAWLSGGVWRWVLRSYVGRAAGTVPPGRGVCRLATG